MRYLIVWSILLCGLILGGTRGHSHSHDHDDGHGHAHHHAHEEPAAHYKYSRQANVEPEEPKLAPPQQPAHAHSHDHGHAHDDHGHGHAHDHGHSHGEQPAAPKGTVTEAPPHHQTATETWLDQPYDKEGFFSFLNDKGTKIWTYSIGSTLLISIAPFLILFAIPIQANTTKHQSLLKVLLAFASGGLLGDAFLHLIPHALMAGAAKAKESEHGHEHDHSHEHHGHSHEGAEHNMAVGLYVLCGMTVFLVLEKLGRILKGEDGHGHSHGPPPKKKEEKKTETKSQSGSGDVRKRKHSHKTSDDDEKEDKSPKAKDSKTEEPVPHPELKMAAILNLIADFAHNITDGLAVGASYLAGTPIGIITTLTVLIHEVPHEIGDFAILVQSGFTKRKAIMIQLCTAIGALLGCCLSLWSSDPTGLTEQAASSWVLPFTAGGFIYIATVSVIPELLEDSGFWQSVKEIIALFIGIAMMVGITFLE